MQRIFNTCPSTKYDDGYIQFVKSADGANATRMLPLPVSMYIDTTKNDNPKQLNIDTNCSSQRKPVQDEFSQTMAAAKPTMIKYKSKWGMNDVV